MTLASKKRPTARLHDTAFYPNRIGDADSCQKSSCKTESAPLLPTNYVVLHRPVSLHSCDVNSQLPVPLPL